MDEERRRRIEAEMRSAVVGQGRFDSCPAYERVATTGPASGFRRFLLLDGPDGVHPWVRFFARHLDVLTCALVIGTIPQVPEGLVLSLAVLTAWTFIEAVLLSTWGTTPAKWMLGVSVRTVGGTKLCFGDALHRSFLVLVTGMGVGLPIISLCTLYRGYRTLTSEGSTRWDRDHGWVVVHQPISAKRPLIALGLVGAVIVNLVVLAIVLPLLSVDGAEVPTIPMAISGLSRDRAAPPQFLIAKRPEGHEDLIVIDGDVTFYFSNRPGRCFAYELPGAWVWGSEEGLVRTTDGRHFVGVLLLSEAELHREEGRSLAERAASKARRDFERHGVPANARMRLTPFAARRFESAKWEAVWSSEGDEWRATRVLVSIAPGWLAQLTVAVDSSDDVYRRIIDTIGTTGQRGCYWPMLGARYPRLRGGGQVAERFVVATATVANFGEDGRYEEAVGA